MRTQTTGIAQALFPLVRQRVLAVLYRRPDQELHLREIVRRSGLAPATVQREVLRLTAAGLLERRSEGRQVYYRANPRCPVFAEMRGLVTKTVGVGEVLREALAPAGERVERAFIFGSVADGTATSDSDLDLLVVGEVTLRELAPLLRPVRETLGREVNATVMTPPEFAAAKRHREHFLTAVLAQPVIWLKGEPDGAD